MTNDSAMTSSLNVCRASSYPSHRRRGCGGYLANRWSFCDRRHNRNLEPVPETTVRTCEQFWHSDSISIDPALFRTKLWACRLDRSPHALRWSYIRPDSFPRNPGSIRLRDRWARQSLRRSCRRYSWRRRSCGKCSHSWGENLRMTMTGPPPPKLQRWAWGLSQSQSESDRIQS